MDSSFAQQLILARMAAEIGTCQHGYESLSSSSKSTNDFHLEQLKCFAEEAGVHITFINNGDLSVQCARARAEHELALLRERERSLGKDKLHKVVGKSQARMPLKIAVKNVQFGLGCR